MEDYTLYIGFSYMLIVCFFLSPVGALISAGTAGLFGYKRVDAALGGVIYTLLFIIPSSSFLFQLTGKSTPLAYSVAAYLILLVVILYFGIIRAAIGALTSYPSPQHLTPLDFVALSVIILSVAVAALPSLQETFRPSSPSQSLSERIAPHNNLAPFAVIAAWHLPGLFIAGLGRLICPPMRETAR